MNYLIFISIVFCSNLYGQQRISTIKNDSLKAELLDEVIISATRTKRQLSSLPLPVTLIPKKQIIQSGTLRLNEIMNEQTGIISVSDESGFEGIQMQGISSDYILILLDGVPLVGRQSGNLDLSRISVGNIKQIEVIKGPSSSLFGSEALGGVINIITDTPDNSSLKGTISHRHGSLNTQDSNLNFSQVIKKLNYSLFTNRLSSDGYDLFPNTTGQTVEPYENYTLQANTRFNPNEKLSIQSSGRYFHQDQEVSFDNSDQMITGNNKINEWNLQLKADHKISSKLTTQYEFYHTNYLASEKTITSTDNSIFSQNKFDQTLLRPEVRTNYSFSAKNTLTSGIGWNVERLDRTTFDDPVSFDSQYAYLQYDFYPLDNVNIIAGARFDRHSEYQSQFSPKISVKYDITHKISIKTSTGFGFKAPDFRQLYFDFTNSVVGYTVLGYNVAIAKLKELEDLGQITNFEVDINQLQNPLKPESSIGFNLGVSYKTNKLSVDINYFRNEIENLIDTRVIARKNNGQNVFSYTNLNDIFTSGIEFNIQYKPLQNLQILAGYQLLYAKDRDVLKRLENGEVFARNSETLQTFRITKSEYFGLLNRSRHTLNIKAFYDIPSWNTNFNIRANYRSKYGLFNNTDGGNDILDIHDPFVKGYTLVNVSATKKFYNKYSLQLGANNMFDYKDAQNISNLIGRQFYGRIEITF